MRAWKRTPQLGGGIAKVSRQYFFSLAIVAMAVISSAYWSGFPFDNLCLVENTEDVKLGTFYLGESRGYATVSVDDPVYTSCLQDLLAPGLGFTFPFIPAQQEKRDEEWMTGEQEEITTLFGWSSVVICALMLLRLVWSPLKHYFCGDSAPKVRF